MEPIPETLEALEELDRYDDDGDLVEHLTATADRARSIAPGLVGVSIGSREHDVTFTLVATDEEIATLDAVQYVATGPCVDAIHLGRGLASSPGGLLSERAWRDFARASAAAGIHSTLTFPVVQARRRDRHREPLRRSNRHLPGQALSSWRLPSARGHRAPSPTPTCPSRRGRRRSRPPSGSRSAAWLDQATGVIAAQRGSSLHEARAQLEDAALRAGVPVIRLARVVLGLHDERPDQ